MNLPPVAFPAGFAEIRVPFRRVNNANFEYHKALTTAFSVLP
jgi:hypothetical protein